METYSPTEAVLRKLEERTSELESKDRTYGDDNPFFVVDLEVIHQRYVQWKCALPNITPYYAVKCNSDPRVLNLLMDLGTGFDCASASEIEGILRLKDEPGRIIYAHPCKNAEGLIAARKAGVKRMTFDTVDELEKIHRMPGPTELLLRIWTDDDGMETHLSRKFGARLEEVSSLLAYAQRLGLNVVGIAFHVGTKTSRSSAFAQALEDSQVAFHKATDLGIHLQVLDVGGGFISHTFEATAKVIRDTIAEKNFPENIEIIAEPGRMFVEDSFTLACRVIGRRAPIAGNPPDQPCMLYLSDGVYGNFANVQWESKQQPLPGVIGNHTASSDVDNEHRLSKKYIYMLWGPTCDGIDRVMKEWVTEHDIHVGDWLYFPAMGAYTSSCTTSFNGFGKTQRTQYLSTH
ncbi:hypothetical protein Q7P37_009699 [Cladosporium fusiforme]